MHYIKTSEARQLVLEAIKTVSNFVRENEKEFIKIIREENELRHEVDSKSRQKQLDKNRKRHEELNGIIKRLFEESAAGKITGKRFEILSRDYEKEQEELEQGIVELQAGLERYEADGEKAEQFIKIVKKYTDFSELTPEMLNEYIEKIVVYEAERVNHRRKQKVEIYLNFIGRFTFPNQTEPDEEPYDPVEEKRAKWRGYYHKDREKILAKKREATAQKRADKKAAKSSEVIATEQQARKDQKREYHREYAKKWREENREKVREISKKYREKKRAEKSRQTA
jgi:hypothetical protein